MSAVSMQVALLVTVGLASLYSIVWGGNSRLAKYTLAWACFHLAEYGCTKRYLPRTVTPHLFLIWGARGAVPLAAVHLASICEYLLTRKYGRHHGLPACGVLLAAAGIFVRGKAIHDCGNSFSHYIETETPQRLVTSGIYAWCRHPSYAGFLLYVVGMQTILGNVLVHALSLVVLVRFFGRRIQIEEHFLVARFYGARYEEYRARVCALVPYVY
ncbi:ICMT-domain-containing protein [Metschnikowia bicuspidata var. bicuspidata NRRL YB-4993]|uniref:Protein-S-isoprenylcysteine O-methyltransferase n=1 Tax=Metschnikowia bicuspidata var. bicuspidata NRRL YB-4993 TaxID=869754 RepID=A0A1A0HIT4_9ASCO|nr:ICMT-domain-containing protein [Metschnikowia bicuspidata var. bicuspidata NRRL YB-4993]OBA23797.1 ICMT-domain-containing protein [Metschnikowia bicuspidata var. bicuspidata NRRL YB-4993]